MISKIISIFWIGGGLFWLIKPSALRNFFKRKTLKRIRKILFIAALVVGFYFIGLALHYKGFIPKVIFILGVLAIIKSFLLLKSKLADKWVGWVISLPLYIFRIFALIYIFIGIILFNLK